MRWDQMSEGWESLAAVASQEGQGLLGTVPLASIEPDPENRPEHKLDPDDPERIDPEDPRAEAKAAFLEGVRELAASMEADGLLQPIRVYPVGPQRYRILCGERRYWAARLLGWETIPAVVLQGPPEAKVRAQLAENVHRADISLAERLAQLEALMREARGRGERVRSVTDLCRISGLGRRAAWRYLRLLQSREAREAVREGRVQTLAEAEALLPGPAEAEVVPLPQEGGGSSPAAAARARRRPTRARQVSLRLDAAALRYLLERVGGRRALREVAEDDPARLKAALLAALQEKLGR